MDSTPLVRLMRHLPVRTYNALVWGRAHGLGYTTVEEVAAASDDDLLDLRNFGSTSLALTRAAVVKVIGEPRTAEDVVRDLRAWLATYPPMPEDATGDPEASIVTFLRRMVGEVGTVPALLVHDPAAAALRGRIVTLIAEVGDEGENEDGWSAHAVERVRELLGDEG